MEKHQLFTPYYYVDEALLINNLKILKSVKKRSGAKILLAQKAFSMFSLYPLIAQYLDGTTASSLHEVKLGHDEFGGETHIFSPAYIDREFEEILENCEHMVFNTPTQWSKFRARALAAGIDCGLRINPEYSTQEHDMYDPAAAGSRLGTTLGNFDETLLEGLSGLHFHTLCEQNSDALKETLVIIEEKFGKYLPDMKWLNFGGGHHITRADYDIETLVSEVIRIQNKYNLQVYLEPGEGVVLNTGFLETTVIDFVENSGVMNAILDTSATTHMPDVIEMPYRPFIIGSGEAGEKVYTYRLGGPSCLAGDVIGDYSFDHPLEIGEVLTFTDMAHYSMVKNNTFNGIGLPSIAIKRASGEMELVKSFGYEDFKMRLS
ncbi:carboxynorspermidine decarboxylase [Lactovum miscens]|uniref:Carboxynorspermidine decarboxylase n=1 Tax=Lactovum miscens TaxID=190387 RepID=A0A841CAV6_9LACT|nr:carboxynorspermidine decarboxylase [Lactovum miscens]MBB5888691.1 carboxynorspermidine decarboxylase [Lactovum miscens]